MKKIKAKPAPKPTTKHAPHVAKLYALILVVMVVLQLFAFEKFIPLLEKYELWGGLSTTTSLAAFIAIIEILALPFLLRMPLSPLMRWVSMASSVLVAVVWMKLAVLALWTDMALQNSGMLGSKIAIPSGWTSFIFSAILLELALYCVLGMWPAPKKKRK